MTPDAFVRHYTAVADASPVPVLLYNYPALTGVNLAPDTVATLGAHPNIAGIKETGSDTAQVAAYVDLAPRGFSVIAGSAPTFFASLSVGAVGGVLAAACVVPDLCVRLFEAFVQGRIADAREMQRRLTPIAQLVTSVYGVPGLKLAMTLEGFRVGEPRAPLAPAPADAVPRIRAELARARENFSAREAS
jgi:4-hydroxy-2-oxoglutarate aldolase